MNRDRDKDKINPVKRKSLLNLLTRRSTKVEPQKESDIIDDTIVGDKSVSVQSTPIKQFHQSSLRRHNSSQNIGSASTTLEVEQPVRSNYCNRFSHQFSLCCSNESATPPPPSSGRLGSDNKSVNEVIHQNGNAVKDEPLIIVHKSPENPLEVNVLVQQQASSSDAKKDPPKPVFNEYQSSIAMSACRSRLRQKLLPPGIKIDLACNEQHFSSPNISEKLNETTGNNRSMSYDILTGVNRPASTDSLAKQSLIAAQLLHLIPAERARER